MEEKEIICEYFQLLTDEEFEEYIEEKYGHSIAATFKKAYGESNDDVEIVK